MGYKDSKLIKSGFSLVEVIVVLALFALFMTIGTAVYNNVQSSNNLEIATGSLVEAIRYAQSNSQAARGDSTWGVMILPDKIVVFKGQNYASREVNLDQSINFPSKILIAGINEIVFEKLNGTTVNTGTITLTNDFGEKNISINEKGTITY